MRQQHREYRADGNRRNRVENAGFRHIREMRRGRAFVDGEDGPANQVIGDQNGGDGIDCVFALLINARFSRAGERSKADGVGQVSADEGAIGMGENASLRIDDHGVAHAASPGATFDHFLHAGKVIRQQPGRRAYGENVCVMQRAARQLVPQEVALTLDEIDDEDRHQHEMHESDAEHELAANAGGGEYAAEAFADHCGNPKAMP